MASFSLTSFAKYSPPNNYKFSNNGCYPRCVKEISRNFHSSEYSMTFLDATMRSEQKMFLFENWIFSPKLNIFTNFRWWLAKITIFFPHVKTVIWSKKIWIFMFSKMTKICTMTRKIALHMRLLNIFFHFQDSGSNDRKELERFENVAFLKNKHIFIWF